MQASQDLALIENLAAIAQLAERYVYSTDPNRTRNPGYRPVKLIADMDLQMIPFPRFLFENSHSSEIKVYQDLEACEPGEAVTITLHPPAGALPTDADARSLCLQLTPRSIHRVLNGRLVIQHNNKEVS